MTPFHNKNLLIQQTTFHFKYQKYSIATPDKYKDYTSYRLSLYIKIPILYTLIIPKKSPGNEFPDNLTI